jgi:hypothetical protein
VSLTPMHQSMSELNSVSKVYKGFKVLLVDVPKPSTPEPDVKLVDIFRINMYLGRVRLQGVGFSNMHLRIIGRGRSWVPTTVN